MRPLTSWETNLASPLALAVDARWLRRDATLLSRQGDHTMNTRNRTIGRSARGLVMACAATLMAFQPAAHACSRIVWAAPDNQVFVGRI